MLWLIIITWLLGWCCIPHLLLLNKRPTATLAWLWAIILFPLIGPLLYLMIGSERIKHFRVQRPQMFRNREWGLPLPHPHLDLDKPSSLAGLLDPPRPALTRGLTNITQLPVSSAQRLQVLRNASNFYEALLADIRKAKDHIHIETYIWRADEVGDLFLNTLIDAARRGVAVRVLIDEVGSLTLSKSYFQPLVAAGGQFSWFHTLSPLRNRYSFNLRNHRKLQVIDGGIAYVGGMNVGREYLGFNHSEGDWFDVQVRVEGSVVRLLEELFAEDWLFGTGKDDIPMVSIGSQEPEEKYLVQVLRSGPDEEDHPMLRMSVTLMAQACTRLWIGSGYFVPGEIMQTSLQVAAARGVDVRLLVSIKSEHHWLVKAGRSYYEALLRQGIKIYEYSRGIEHSKYIVIDEDLVSVGSSNLDERSMRLNFELSLLTHSRETNQEFANIFLSSIAQSQEVDPTNFSQRPLSEKLIESAVRLLSPLL